VLEIGIEEY